MNKVNYYLVNAAKYLLCTVSMALTALFALSFSSNGSLGLTYTVAGESYFVTALAVIIGISVDLSKYLFWQAPERKVFRLISIQLVVFSWLASVAFFVSQSAGTVEKMRKQTAVYAAHDAKIKAIQTQIASKHELIEKRFGSQYHKQWDKGEDLVNEVADLNLRLQILIKEGSDVGLREARRSLVSTALFIKLADIGHISTGLVETFFYGLLALLIEICSLGMVSLSRYYYSTPAPAKPGYDVMSLSGKAINEKKLKLEEDIVNGKVRPVFREIQAGRYGLSRKLIIEVLDSLKQKGILESAPRNSLKLAKSIF